MSAPLVVVGDALLDRDVEGAVERLAPDAPVPVVDERQVRTRPGGAGLAALLAASDGRDVTLVTALGADAAGRELRAALEAGGVRVVDLGLRGATPEKIRIRVDGRSMLRLDRGGDDARTGALTAAARAAIGWAGAILVADYGRGITAADDVRDALGAVARDGVPVVWDPHPRGREPIAGVALATPNAAEAERFSADLDLAGDAAGADGGAERADGAEADARARVLAAHWGARHVCVTRGARGAVVASAEAVVAQVPAEAVEGGDPCGAGDRFASRAAQLLADGADVERAVAGAVEAASAFVAAGGAGSITSFSRAQGAAAAAADGAEAEDVEALIARVRANGGTVVATGGCFDLLHPGHVRTLEAARALGDCLVVLLNDDDSVRRLKGEGRPVVGEEDRADVLRALRCVDAVVLFAEDTPTAALERLRPDVWAKGGDYTAADLPEAEALARWGGRIAVLPYLEGRSTTNMIKEAAIRAV